MSTSAVFNNPKDRIQNHIQKMEQFCVGFIRYYFNKYNIKHNPNDISSIIFNKLIDYNALSIKFIHNPNYTPNIYFNSSKNNNNSKNIICNFKATKLADCHNYSTIIFKPIINNIFCDPIIENNSHLIKLKFLKNKFKCNNAEYGNGGYFVNFGVITF